MDTDEEFRIAYFAERDVPCPGCGYNLRGLRSDHCPECNEVLEIRVRLAEPHTGALLVAAAGLAFGAGFATFMSALWLISLVIDGHAPPLPVLLSLIGEAAVTGVPLIWLVRPSGRRWFRTRKRRTRRLIVPLCWGLTFTAVGVGMACVAVF